MCFFFQAEDGIRDYKVTGVQTCALPIYWRAPASSPMPRSCKSSSAILKPSVVSVNAFRRAAADGTFESRMQWLAAAPRPTPIGRASCRGRGEISGGAGSFKKKKKKKKTQ